MKKETNHSFSFLVSTSPITLRLLHWLSEKAAENRVSIYVVGGFVRDLILQRSTMDFDLVIEGNTIHFAQSLSRTYGGKLVIHPTFKTAVWNFHSAQGKIFKELGINELEENAAFPSHLDFISAREEIYPHPAALPIIKPGNLESDLQRRDFTINTLAINLNKKHFGDLVDLFQGFKDIKGKQIRVLHDRSFNDDPTRQLRAIRFEQRFGFQIEHHTLALMQEALGYLGNTTGIRIRHEMDMILEEDNIQKMLARAQDLGILSNIHPSLDWDGHLIAAFQEIDYLIWEKNWGIKPAFGKMGFKTGMKYCLWLSTYANEIQNSIAKRLSIPQAILKAAGKTYHLKQAIPKLLGKSASQITFQLDTIPMIAILASAFSESNPRNREILDHYLHDWRRVIPFSTGHDLQKLGLPVGPTYKVILNALRAAKLDGQIRSYEEELNLLQKLLTQNKLLPKS